MTEASTLTGNDWQAFDSRLRAYVGRRVDPAAADDVVGDILLRLTRHQAGLVAADNPTAWMLRVAANAVADHHRRRSTERRALAQAEVESGLDPAGATEDASAGVELAQCLIPLLRVLPAPYGEALLLTDIGGLSQPEAAKRLGLSASGMKSRVQRGRAKLKQAVLRCCAVELDRRGGVVDFQPRSATCVTNC